MDQRILRIRTAQAELDPWTPKNDEDEVRYVPTSEFSDLVRPIKKQHRMGLLYDYQLDVVKHEIIELNPKHRQRVYTTQDLLKLDALVHYLDVGPNGKLFDTEPWMDDPLPVLYPYLNGWRVIDGNHRVVVAHLLKKTVYCARAVDKRADGYA